jgi:putative inorganic carbon (HCO3(-)) transporter
LTEIVLLALIGPLALFPSPGRFAALLAIPAWWAWRWARPPAGVGRGFVPRTPLDGAILLLALMVLVSVFASRDLSASLPKIAGVVYGIGVYYAVVRACRAPRAAPLWAGLGVFVLAGAGIAALALIGTRWPVKFAFLDYFLALLPVRLAGLPGAETGFDPNEVAGSLVWVIPLALALPAAALARPSVFHFRQRPLVVEVLLAGVLGAALLMLAVLFLTQSRAGLVGHALAAFGMFLVAIRRRRAAALGLLAVAILAASLVVAVVGPTRLLQFVVGFGGSGGQPASLYTVEGRIEMWVRAIYGIQDFPFTGMGMNIFRLLVHSLYPMYLVEPGVDIGHAHNLWLQAALDLGVPGLVAYLGLWLGAAAMLVGAWRAAGQSAGLHSAALGRPVAVGLGGGLLAHLVFGLTDAVALGAKPGLVWWLMLGLIASLPQPEPLEKSA